MYSGAGKTTTGASHTRVVWAAAAFWRCPRDFLAQAIGLGLGVPVQRKGRDGSLQNSHRHRVILLG